MIRARLYRSPEGHFTGYRIAGHAGYAAADAEDIVCAAVSVLAVTCCNTLEQVTGRAPEAEEGDGLLKVELTVPPSHDSDLVFSFLQNGLESLSETYPDHVSLQIC